MQNSLWISFGKDERKTLRETKIFYRTTFLDSFFFRKNPVSKKSTKKYFLFLILFTFSDFSVMHKDLFEKFNFYLKRLPTSQQVLF